MPWLIVAGMWIGAGILLNEWTLAAVLKVEQWGPRSLAFIWICNVCLVGFGLVTLFFSNWDIVKSLNLLLITVVVLIASAEFTLRIWPSVLGREFTNGLFTKYSTKPGGIYYYDPVVRMNFMIPNYETEMHYNGHRWTHRTDALGFRNPVSRDRADVILLGDSFIYGHGVNIDQTVGHFVEQMTDYTIMNLARQGDSSLQEAYLLTRYIGQLKPLYVFYFYSENDIRDLYMYRTDEELSQFLESPIAFEGAVDPGAALKIRNHENGRDASTGALRTILKNRLRLSKVRDWIHSRQGLTGLEARSMDPVHNVDDESSLGWRFTKTAIRYMADLANSHRAQFIIVPITPNNKRHFDILQRFATEERIWFVDTSRIALSDRSLFLVGDGHFSEKGARAIAGLISEYLDACKGFSSHCSQFARK